MIAISPVRLEEEEERLVLDVIRSGSLAQGPMVERFERACANLIGTSHSIAVSSGTGALVAVLKGLELQPNDEVITSPFTFAATLNAILEAGAIARFVDVGEDLTLDTDALEAAITPATKAILPVHLYGYPADMERIEKIARAYGLRVVEDAAQALGSQVGDRPVGSFDVGCFSFYATKAVTTGEGGLITTDDDDLARRIRLLRNQGMSRRYQYELPGLNLRMTEIQAAMGLPQVSRLQGLTEKRRQNAAYLSESLSGIPGIVVPAPLPGREHVYHQYTVRVTEAASINRQSLAHSLADRGIETGIYYPRVVFDYVCYREHPQVRAESMPRAEAASWQVLSIPTHPWLSNEDLEEIILAIRESAGA